ncbi:MAG TPA: exodeoxyribonuclease VII large subunit, partial [Candidatus Brocadiia bacterium]|nr:exodeoxyribonuclease VII large subunit [Candidatus Brocadiia bacterium]
RRPSSGHVYLSLKDSQAQISAVMWRGPAARLPFNLQDGMEVIAQGEITVYEPRGQYQIVLRHIQPKGVGALQLAFLQLKEKLEKEGLFAPKRKRPLPFIPARIGIVTSPSGAAIHDMLQTITTRFPAARVLVCPARVQGQGAAEEIAAAIAALNRVPDVDVIIAGRGGGSLEDLWAFNEEVVARAIAASRAPVISAVGHEIDVTISDLVADRRALTPTDAGRIVVPELSQIQETLGGLRQRLGQSLRRRVSLARESLTAISRSYAFRRPLDRIRQLEQRVDALGHRMACSASSRLPLLRQRLKALQGRLDALSPQRVLSRGYSITLHPDGRLVRAAAEAQPGAVVRTRLQDGEFKSQVIP